MNRILPRHRHFTLGAFVVVGFVAACETAPGEASGGDRQSAAEGVRLAPVFEVDPFWPKALPNHGVTGSTIGLAVDAQDNVWTIHRPESVEDNFRAADLTAGEARGDEVQPGAPSIRRPIGRARCGTSRSPEIPIRPTSTRRAAWTRRSTSCYAARSRC